MADAIRVKITKPAHITNMGRAIGMSEAQEALEDLPVGVRQTPGVALAIATIKAEANSFRADLVAKNLATIAKAGHDVAHYMSVSYDANTAELVCEFYDPDLFDSETAAPLD